LLASALAVAPVAAQNQDEDEAAPLEEVVVTGSRIVRQDFTANSPITTIDQTTFENTSTIGVETVLNQLPQFVPAVTQFTTTDVQQTAVNTIGASTVSLRGLGANRNLVLIDGKRGQPINSQMVVNTNLIPSAAIARVEVISGGASAVYGADAVGGVVNFILKDNFEGATVDVRFGDTFDGGNQEVTISGLIGANAGDRGNVMMGMERSSRSKQFFYERDWRIEDASNPAIAGTAYGWGSDTWISNVQGTVGNNPSQAFINNYFSQAVPCTVGAPGAATTDCHRGEGGRLLGVLNTSRFLVNRPSGTLYTGLMDTNGVAGSYKYEGPYMEDNFGRFEGLPFRQIQPQGHIKENNFWTWSTTPLERLSAFAKGHFEISDNVRLTGQLMFVRTETQTNLGLTADTITVWGSEIPFGTTLYRGNPAVGIPNSWNDTNNNGAVDPGETTNNSYLPGGRFGLNCNADGQVGCTENEAFPLPPDFVALFQSRPTPENNVWLNRPPDWAREALGASRSGVTIDDIMQFTLGIEGDLPSGNHSWDIAISTGETDSLATQRGSARLSSWRAIAGSPNFGVGYIGDPNPFSVGFAESIPTCTTGLPVLRDFAPSSDCLEAIFPDLKNRNTLTQSFLEANLVGDLTEMKAGPLSYALGTTYREAEFAFEPDNLSLNMNITDPIAGLFPNTRSTGDFDVAEVYGELLVPIVSDGPWGVEHFNVELGGRVSKWSMAEVDTIETYKALIDWAFTPNYRLRGGYNRAHRAPNLGELYLGRTQVFGGAVSIFGDQCSQRNASGPYSANHLTVAQAQVDQTLAICTQMMGAAGTQQYYGTATPVYGNIVNTTQTTGVGGVGTGTPNSFGNANLHEEQADTWTLGVAMNFLENWQFTVDYYTIEIKDMIAVESPDSLYERCLSITRNPGGSISNPACQQILRDPTNGGGANVDLSYTNLGRARVEGVDLQLNWRKMLASGGFNVNMVANYNLLSETQERVDLPTREWQGTSGCALQIQCQGYDYRVFTTINYFRGGWGLSLRHQYWPTIESGACVTAPQTGGCWYGGVATAYNLFGLSGNIQIGDKYTLRMGIDNLLDEDPPLNQGNPDALPFATPPSHVGNGATYDPLGRRAFVSMTMDF
jgi:outer membrane receptor protein involved in Fe transport